MCEKALQKKDEDEMQHTVPDYRIGLVWLNWLIHK
jgi:hypothetical protein